jgi:glycine cleavage system aminomethyltransferase T
VLDKIIQAGDGQGLRPFGEDALMMLRIEAGLPLVDVEWRNSRTAFSDHQRVTPVELGMRWMLRGVADDDRAFVGGAAIRRELATASSRWASVGIVVDWMAWDSLHRDAGLLPPKDEHPLPYESVLHDRPTTAGAREGHSHAGYVTSFMYSPVLQKHIGLARVRPELATPGTEVHMELAINHANTTVLARTARLPLFNPPRKVAKP